MEIKDLMKPKKLVLSALILLSLISIAQENEVQESDLDKELSEVTGSQQASEVPAFESESAGLPEEGDALSLDESANENSPSTQGGELDSQMAEVENSMSSGSADNSGMAMADESSGYIIDETQPSGEVSIERVKDLTLPYKERRGKHGVLFSVFSEKFYPYEYLSLFEDSSALEDINGAEDINMMGLEIGYKFNFALGSLAALFNFSSGETNGAVDVNGTASLRDIKFTRYGGSINYAADNIFREPYLVPYGQVGIHQFTVDESATSGAEEVSDSATTEFSFNYKVGMLFQLNWIEKSIDPSTHIDGLRSSGLENTYLDVYMAWHMPSQNLFSPEQPEATAEGDPDLTSEAMLGVGLKLEF